MAINTDIFLGSGATLTMIPELDLKVILNNSGSTTTKLVVDALWSDNVRMVENLYVGCVVDLYDNDVDPNVIHSTHVITANDATSFTISPAHDRTIEDAADFIVIRGYGAPAPTTLTGSIARLSADN